MTAKKAERLVVRRRKWLQALLDVENRVELVICRYHLRRGGFDHLENRVREHMLTLGEQGQLHAEVDGHDIRIGAGDALWITPGIRRRRYCAEGDNELLRYYNLRFRLVQDGKDLVFARRPVLIHNAWDLRYLMYQLYDLYQHGHMLAEERLRGLLLAISSGFMALVGEGKRVPAGRTLSPAQRLRINRYVVDHMEEGLKPEDLALEAGLSLDYFSRLFRRTYGTSPRSYLKRERARLAALQLLETDLSVAAIARQSGTDNVSLFCRQFRDVMGCTPSEYRRREAPPQG